MKPLSKIVMCILVLLLASCGNKFPPTHVPMEKLTEDDLSNYIIAYCWQYSDGRNSNARPFDKEVAIVISSATGKHMTLIRNKMNLTGQALSDFVIYKSGCVEQGDEQLRYSGFALSWKPQSNEITYTEGSDRSSTRFDSQILKDGFKVSDGNLADLLKGYKEYFWSPRGIYWSSDGNKIATIGRDVGILNSQGDNIWAFSKDRKSFTRITSFNEAGDFIANASWSKDGNKLAIEYRNQNGIGIAKFKNSTDLFSYTEVTNKQSSLLSEFWPYAYHSPLQLIYDLENIDFNSYISNNSFPVFVNNDEQIVFSASSRIHQGTLFIVDADGENLRPFLPNLTGLIFMPRLSPDGRTLAFVRYPDWKKRSQVEIATVDILTMDINSLAVLSTKKGTEMLVISGLDWSPDGRYLAFSSNHAHESDIYILSVDGKKWMNLTENLDGNAVSPLWKP